MPLSVQPIEFKPEGPQPLVCEPPEGAPYPVDALGPLGAVVGAVQGATLAPHAIAGQSALACASLVVQGHADVETLGGRRPTSLFSLTIARSGERKSSVDEHFMNPIREFEMKVAKEHMSNMAAWDNDMALWEAKHRAHLEKAKKAVGTSDMKAKAELDGLDPKPLAPVSPELTVSEPTFEGLTLALRYGRPSLGVFSDEGGQFLGGYAMSKENRQKTMTGFNGLWDGKPIKRTRQGDGTSTLYGRRVATHLMAQPTVAHKFTDDGLAEGTGLLARFLISQPKSYIGSRFHEHIKTDTPALEDYGHRMKTVLDRTLPIDEHIGALTPRLLPLSTGAKDMLIAFSDELEARQAKNGDLAGVTAAASKATEQAARIAGVLTLWDDLDAPHVGTEAMANGIELARYYLGEAVRLAGTAATSRAVEEAETLRKWLIESFEHPEVVPRDVQNGGPTRGLRSGPRARAALSLLETYKWLVKLEPGALVRGAHRQEAWKIVGKSDF